MARTAKVSFHKLQDLFVSPSLFAVGMGFVVTNRESLLCIGENNLSSPTESIVRIHLWAIVFLSVKPAIIVQVFFFVVVGAFGQRASLVVILILELIMLYIHRAVKASPS